MRQTENMSRQNNILCGWRGVRMQEKDFTNCKSTKVDTSNRPWNEPAQPWGDHSRPRQSPLRRQIPFISSSICNATNECRPNQTLSSSKLCKCFFPPTPCAGLGHNINSGGMWSGDVTMLEQTLDGTEPSAFLIISFLQENVETTHE